MTGTPFAERVSERLGALTTEMANTREDMAEIKALITSNDARANQSRKHLYDAVETLKVEVARQSMRMDDIAMQAERGANVATKVDRWEQQGKGILIAAGVAGASVMATATVFFDAIVKWLKLKLGL